MIAGGEGLLVELLRGVGNNEGEGSMHLENDLILHSLPLAASRSHP